MAVNQVTTTQLTGEALSIDVQMNSLMNRINLWTAFVIAVGTGGLQAAPYNMTSGDATDLFNAAQDWSNYRKVFLGLMYVTFGATLNTGTPTNNDVTHFGYPFNANPGKVAGLGY